MPIPEVPWSLEGLPPMSSLPSAPIALFDSGVGGLTVLSALSRALPKERTCYLADQAHVPYGGRPLDEIRRFAGSITRFFAAEGAKAVVMACNISSATTHAALAAAYGPGRVFGMIEAGAAAAIEGGAPEVIGVLATEGTVRSGAYTEAIQARASDTRVVEVACPDFVPLVEAGRAESAEAVAAAARYLGPIEAAGARRVILGCTHYPYLESAIQRAAARPLSLLDPAEAVVAQLKAELTEAGRLAEERAGPDRLFTTGEPARLSAQLPALGLSPAPAEPLRWGSA